MGIKLLIWIVGLGTLIAGAIGVMNIMLVTVSERQKEIGIRRALGARPRNIIRQIIQESIFVTFFSGYLGLLFSLLLLEGISSTMENTPDSVVGKLGISFSSGILAFGILLIVGFLAGIIPAQRALNIEVIEALKDE